MDTLKFGVNALGRKELIKFEKGKVLSRNEAIYAKCYDCMGGYDDGKIDCLVSSCPLYPFMPYLGIDD